MQLSLELLETTFRMKVLGYTPKQSGKSTCSPPELA
jgi:hypothetical protein